MSSRKTILLGSLFAAVLALPACGNSVKTEAKYPSGLDRNQTGDDIYGEKQSIFGEDGLNIFGSKKKDDEASGSGIGVNSFLWRASLDTVSFMPIASADPFEPPRLWPVLHSHTYQRQSYSIHFASGFCVHAPYFH